MAEIAKEAKIYVAGHRGMVGSSIVRRLRHGGYHNLVLRTHDELDLRDSGRVNELLRTERPEFVFFAAARVGGIHANNTFRAEFLYDNLMMEANIVNAAHLADVDRLMFLGSSCIYPRDSAQPIKEEYLLSGPLEWTNEPYAIAKIAGVKLCENYSLQYGRRYFSCMPTNTYGPGDNFHPEYSHVMAALIRKAHWAKIEEAAQMIVWGSGEPRREFIYADDLADACVFLMESGFEEGLINIGTNSDVTIRELAETVARVVGFEGALTFDSSKPDGTRRKLMDSSKLATLGWSAKTSLEEGIAKAYAAAPFISDS